MRNLWANAVSFSPCFSLGFLWSVKPPPPAFSRLFLSPWPLSPLGPSSGRRRSRVGRRPSRCGLAPALRFSASLNRGPLPPLVSSGLPWRRASAWSRSCRCDGLGSDDLDPRCFARGIRVAVPSVDKAEVGRAKVGNKGR